jgi:hypothetical protein
LINEERKFCYRITHINNLPLLLQNGIVNKNHPKACDDYIEIGNPEIIDVRSNYPVKINNYGMIGEYVPFYFTPKSIMLYNIITGYWHPIVPRRNRNEILVIRCLIEHLATLSRWFFTDGQGNDMSSRHYNDLANLDAIDWECIQNCDFTKSDGDFDRPRRYQAEFLVHHEVPIDNIESLIVFNKTAEIFANQILNENNKGLTLHINPQYFF